MKRSILFCIWILPLLSMLGCKKENFTSDNTAAIQVINGAMNVPIMLKMNERLTTGISSFPTSKVNFRAGAFFYASGSPTSISILNATDSTNLVTGSYPFKKGGIYTLLVAGQVPNVETILIEETNYPFVPQSKIPQNEDSIINIKFINLCPDANPLDIRLQGSSTNEVNGLDFKRSTPFKSYPAKVVSYNGTIGYSVLSFQFLDGNDVLRSFSLFVYNVNRFKNVALVITGKKDPGTGEPGLSVSTVNYFQ